MKTGPTGSDIWCSPLVWWVFKAPRNLSGRPVITKKVFKRFELSKRVVHSRWQPYTPAPASSQSLIKVDGYEPYCAVINKTSFFQRAVFRTHFWPTQGSSTAHTGLISFTASTAGRLAKALHFDGCSAMLNFRPKVSMALSHWRSCRSLSVANRLSQSLQTCQSAALAPGNPAKNIS
ncbi:MAG: hypothetical protein NTZ64_15855 [Polaromonas sp.]|nr:hypothetical protein [Polaromonas sp.]